jgi:hypothetical protein
LLLGQEDSVDGSGQSMGLTLMACLNILATLKISLTSHTHMGDLSMGVISYAPNFLQFPDRDALSEYIIRTGEIDA